MDDHNWSTRDFEIDSGRIHHSGSGRSLASVGHPLAEGAPVE